MAANSSWTSDGKGLVYTSTDNPEKIPQLYIIDVTSGKKIRIPTPTGRHATDPHIRNNRVLFPVIDGRVDSIWIMSLNGSDAHQITHPDFGKNPKHGRFKLGDYDPRFSLDATRVVFMRFFGGENWHIFVIDPDGKHEKDLSPPDTTDGLPDWSGDVQRLIFMHVDRKQPKNIGLYTVRPDGSERQLLPLPRGFVFFHSSFFPGDGSSSKARIVYAATRNPKVP